MAVQHGREASVFMLDYLAGLRSVIDAVPVEDVQRLVSIIEEVYHNDRQIFIVGNGGSAATASHMACDLAKTTLGKEINPQARRFRVLSLTDNVALMTAWGNDVDYAQIFAEQLRNLARQGDALILITASGNSPNILEAASTARELGLKTIGMLGFDGGRSKSLVDHCIVVESDHYGYIEDLHMILTHMITAYFKDRIKSNRPLP